MKLLIVVFIGVILMGLCINNAPNALDRVVIYND